MKLNESIRRAARTEDIPLYAIANEMGISESTIMRWLRFPLAPDTENRIMMAISKISKEKNNEVATNN